LFIIGQMKKGSRFVPFGFCVVPETTTLKSQWGAAGRSRELVLTHFLGLNQKEKKQE
jgi:hypothetical protein